MDSEKQNIIDYRATKKKMVHKYEAIRKERIKDLDYELARRMSVDLKKLMNSHLKMKIPMSKTADSILDFASEYHIEHSHWPNTIAMSPDTLRGIEIDTDRVQEPKRRHKFIFGMEITCDQAMDYGAFEIEHK